MRRRFRWDKKYLYWGITAFLVIAAAVLFYMLLQHLPDLQKAWNKMMTILAPFVWGLILAYLLLPLTRQLEKLFSSKRMKLAHVKGKFARTMAIIISEIVLLVLLTAFVLLILPQLYSSVETIVVNSPEYYNKMSEWVELLPSMGNVITSVTTGVYAAFRGIYNLIIGIIVSIYILGNREMAKAGFRKVLYSLFSVETCEKIRSGILFTDRTFMGFLTGKLLDSAIIGLVCYIVCVILKMPYALLVSVMIGLTNIIPFFGPLIGLIPSAFIILLVDPFKCLIFVIFIVILQQIDGNILGPKILGSSVGINGFWVMFAIILGGGLFGFPGMILGVPVFVVIYSAMTTLIDRKLKREDLPQDYETYSQLDYIDPATREVHLKKTGQ